MQEMINPSLTRGEYWLLEAVAELPIPVSWLDHVDMEEILNKTGHGMDRFLLVQTMQKLFTEGLIVAARGNRNEKLVFSFEHIEAALNETRNGKEHYYRLTSKGGRYWEAFARPDWDLYICCWFKPSGCDDVWAGEIICANRKHLEGYFKSLNYHEYNVDPDSIRWDLLEPWEATYWKRLPLGHRIRFLGREKDLDGNSSFPTPIDQLWYDSLWYRWR